MDAAARKSATASAPAACQQQPVSDGSMDRLRGMLLEVGSSFIGFDKAVEDGAQRMRTRRQEQIDEVQAGLHRIEKTLTAEIQDRAEWAKSIRENVERSLDTMRCSLHNKLAERSQQLGKHLAELTDRCSMLECGIRQFKGEAPSKLQVETTALWQEARTLQAALEASAVECLDKDAHLLQQIAEADHKVDCRMAQELTLLERQLEVLQQQFEDFTSSEETTRASTENSILKRLQEVDEDLKAETRCRERADDDLVKAINRYTT
eukprot:4300617-Amphidinium_carterae.1